MEIAMFLNEFLLYLDGLYNAPAFPWVFTVKGQQSGTERACSSGECLVQPFPDNAKDKTSTS